MSIRPGEIVRRGVRLEVRADGELPPEAARAIAVAGHRVAVEPAAWAPGSVRMPADRRAFLVDTTTLPVGPHVLRISEVGTRPGDGPVEEIAIPFVVVDTPAALPDELVVHHAVRLRIDGLTVERLPMAEGPVREGSARDYVDVFKAEDRRSAEPVQVAYDHDGKPVDLEHLLAQVAARRQDRYRNVHPTLSDVVARTGPDEAVPVAVWLHTPDVEPAGKSTTAETAGRPPAEEEARRQRKDRCDRFAAAARRVGLVPASADESAPVVYGRIAAGRVAELAARDGVAAVFLHEREGVEDLADSIAIANTDDAHAAGTTGTGVNVAVYEDGPDDTTNLDIAARFTTSPATSSHARHTHGIVKNVEANRPHGHAPDCTLHSANSMDLAAIRWAAQDRGCTVISQSFHRASEQTSSALSFDDVYKDHLALHWPYPTICEAAGNGTSAEYVNHKGFNRLTVGNHNDAASAMASDSAFRNPASPHSDRELPEIAANGVAVTTVGLTFSGTSMAAPAVAGAAALIQQADATLRSWPEGCRAILLAAAWRNPAGGTWWADVVTGADAADGSGALDSAEGVRIAGSRQSRDNRPTRRGWDVGTFRPAEVGADGFATYVYRIAVPRRIIGPTVKVALAWDSKVTALNLAGSTLPLTSQLTVDLDLHVRDLSGSTVAWSASWDNSYEIAEFPARAGETYEVRIRRWSGTDNVWYGVAWTVTGLDLFLDRIPVTQRPTLGRR